VDKQNIGGELKVAHKSNSTRRLLLTAIGLLSFGVPLAICGAAAPASRVQSAAGAPPPTFEVASVKPNRGGIEKGGKTRIIEPGRITYMNASLGELIEMAYGIKHYQLSGPDWIVNRGSSDRFDVIATAGTPVSIDEVKQMLGPLVVERFHLTFHRETRELPVFELVIAKGGPKFEQSDGAGGVQSVREKGGPKSKQSNESGGAQGMKPDGQGGFFFRNWTMAAFANWLSGLPSVGRPVIDRTGLEGRYSFDANLFNFSKDTEADDSKRAMMSGDASDAVFSTLQTQLGLKLVAQKATIEIIVIDHADKIPTEN
jgi:uncharacterized protein (TIGR03435 family)